MRDWTCDCGAYNEATRQRCWICTSDLSVGSKVVGCAHDWKVYRGLNHDDLYCIKCKETKPYVEEKLPDDKK